MRAPALGAVLSISVDLEANLGHQGNSLSAALNNLAIQLADLFAAGDLPVTWTTADPSNCAALAQICKTAPQHEIAVWAPTEWFQRDLGSLGIGELTRRLGKLRQSGLRTTTLAIDSSEAVELDLPELKESLVKQGFTAVRAVSHQSSRHANRGDANSGAVALRYGLWQISPDVRLTAGSSWEQLLDRLRIRRAIDRGIRARGRCIWWSTSRRWRRVPRELAWPWRARWSATFAGAVTRESCACSQ